MSIILIILISSSCLWARRASPFRQFCVTIIPQNIRDGQILSTAIEIFCYYSQPKRL